MGYGGPVIIVLLSVFYVNVVLSATIDDVELLQSTLLANYNKNVRPIYDQNQAINVTLVLYLKSIQDFDEVNGKFVFGAAISLGWVDYKIQWDFASTGIYQISLSYEDVWVPELQLSSPSSQTTILSKKVDRVRYYYTGNTEWLPAGLIESTCSVNVRNYPFDTQRCSTSYVCLGYFYTEVALYSGRSDIDMHAFSPNELWDVVGSEINTVLLGTGGVSEIMFTVILKRKPTFVVVNVILPILLLSLLNGLVFALVPESGERIGYCITTLLAIAVYMTIMSDNLPKTSKPVPLISYKLMVDMFVSFLIVVVTVFNLRLHHRDDDIPVPAWLQSVYRFLSLAWCRNNKVDTDEETEDVRDTRKPVFSPRKRRNSEIQIISDNPDPITWKKISFMVDMLAITIFTLTSLINFFVFIGMARSGD